MIRKNFATLSNCKSKKRENQPVKVGSFMEKHLIPTNKHQIKM